MLAWETPLTLQDLVLDLALVSILLVLATLLRRYVRFFQTYLIGFLAADLYLDNVDDSLLQKSIAALQAQAERADEVDVI